MVDGVESEDDGPEDFTINMEKWMLGAGDRKGDDGFDGRMGEEALKGRMMDEGMARGGESEKDCQDEGRGKTARVDDYVDGESMFVPLASSTPRLDHHPQNVHDDDPDPEQCVTTSIPAPGPNTAPLPETAAEMVFNQISLLQSEVHRLHHQATQSQAETRALDHERRQLDLENENLAHELAQAKERITQLERADAAHVERWNKRLARQQESTTSKVGSLRVMFEPLGPEPASIQKKGATATNEADADATISDLVQQFHLSADESGKARDDGSTARGDEPKPNIDPTELTSLRSEVARCKESLAARQAEAQAHIRSAEQSAATVSILTSELPLAQEQLVEMRRPVKIVEQESDRLSRTNESKAHEIEALKTELRRPTTESRAPASASASASATVIHVETSPETVKIPHLPPQPSFIHAGSHLTEADADADTVLADQLDRVSDHYESALARQQQRHTAEVKKLQAALMRAAEGMRKREARQTRNHRDESAGLKRQASRLDREVRSLTVDLNRRCCSRPVAVADDVGEVAELRSAIRVLGMKVQAGRVELARSRQALVQMGIEHEVVNKGVEERVAGAFERREREWRRRVKVLLEERERMGKALMLGWGGMEVGVVVVDGDGQGDGGSGGDGDGGNGGERKKEVKMGFRYAFAKRGDGVV